MQNSAILFSNENNSAIIVETRVQLEGVLLSALIQGQKNKYYLFSFVCEIFKNWS